MPGPTQKPAMGWIGKNARRLNVPARRAPFTSSASNGEADPALPSSAG